ncbi:MAG TPA: CDP-alcohol phosphatidyltransferase family protein [Spirochaetota bacterium]|nr:CDP-alcohol phosphatidyltransferase family protein [Spirochaetota bacterium]HPF04803.1 CDP-alcohol phosphatidyltransferase family protein [Spirochaetota bacterium]HPJ41228.1 CDP-alcohol phosphatidyltransferase family protein [Spirochaetota bacterium]HPR38783.1 CDP-alcohol phosphatidyltransferase family protein [Spirochaetota bacterium]HRX46313.1 CDP-alcohol phosphatidyltransferase family protein [Spirochaetota bacterium]
MGRKKSIIPNIFTMGNMVMGFLSILFSASYDSSIDNYEVLAVAGILIFVGSIFDASDGAIARALNVESEIGMQLDSLADAVAYGIAPGVLAYQAFFFRMPEIFGLINIGMLVAVIFTICAVYRLARFNCTESIPGFIGLPSPPAGIVVGIVPSLMHTTLPFFGEINFEISMYLYLPFFLIIAFLMVSSVDYTKLFSDIWKKGMTARVITVVVVVLLLIFFKTWAIFTVTLLYIVAGVLKWSFKKVQGEAV